MAQKHYSHKQIRKSMKHDELRDLLENVYTFGRKHTENLLISAIILTVVIVLIPLYFSNREQNEVRASGLLNRAINYSMQPVAEGLADPNSGEFRTLQEKYKKVQEAYGEISGAYRNTRTARLALVGEGNANFYLKEYDKALALYQDAYAKESDPQVKASLSQRIAACYENQGKWQEALTAYQSIGEGKNTYFNQRSVRMAMAHCYLQLGQPEKAQEIWKQEAEVKNGGYWTELARHESQLHAQNQK